MRLFAVSFILALRHGARRLIVLLALLLICTVGVAALTRVAARPTAREPTRVAVVLEDTNPLTRRLISVGLSSGYEGAFTIDVLTPDAPTDGYAAVAILPQGFLDSILNGENRSPTLRVDVSSPPEAMAARQLARSATQVLNAAQRGIVAAQARLQTESLSAEARERLIFECNLTLLDAFFGRRDQWGVTTLSATGALTLTQHYTTAAFGMLLCGYAFLFRPTVQLLRGFWGRCGKRAVLFPACCGAVAVWSAGLLLPFALSAGGVSAVCTPAFALAVLLGTGYAMLLSCAFDSFAGCAAVSIGLSAAMGLLCGGFLPAALTPPALLRIGRRLPLAQLMDLLGSLYGGGWASSTAMASMATVVLLFAAAALCWRRTPRRRMVS